MPNIGGPSQSKRALLGTVVNSKMLYASPTWAVRGTKTAKNRAELARAQRTVALRITRAYRTVSGDASSVLASMLPADLLATERARVRVRLDDQTDVAPSTVKNQERIISIAAWQARWDQSDKGRWTYQLLPDVGRWLTKPPLTLTFRLTQGFNTCVYEWQGYVTKNPGWSPIQEQVTPASAYTQNKFITECTHLVTPSHAYCFI
ncbi:hypothetical protein QTP88_024904 [Uroleucon formosanum]